MKMLKAGVYLLLVGVSIGCSNASMRNAPESKPPEPDEAVVIFYRASGWVGSGQQPPIYDGDRLVGLLETGSRIEYRCKPGKRMFVCFSIEDSKSAISANLAGGKTYCVKLDLTRGKWDAILPFIPVLKTSPDWKKTEAYSGLEHRELNPERRAKREASDKERLNKVKAHFEGAGKDGMLPLNPEDGW